MGGTQTEGGDKVGGNGEGSGEGSGTMEDDRCMGERYVGRA